jgi:hypothetical protein
MPRWTVYQELLWLEVEDCLCDSKTAKQLQVARSQTDVGAYWIEEISMYVGTIRSEEIFMLIKQDPLYLVYFRMLRRRPHRPFRSRLVWSRIYMDFL